MKTYQIRYNTERKSERDKWRLVEDGKEMFVAQININGIACTTDDWVNLPTDEIPHLIPKKKSHITCQGECEIVDCVAYIKCKDGKDNSLLRHTLKTISYRFLGTLTTFTVSYITTSSIVFASTIGFTELMIKPLLYFAHERVWYKFVKFKK